MLKKPEMILIDVDGTLVDLVPDLAYCVGEMMKYFSRLCIATRIGTWKTFKGRK